MLVPIRCFSCAKPIGHQWAEYSERVEKGESGGDVMTSLGLDKYCCRAIFLGHVDLVDSIGQYRKF